MLPLYRLKVSLVDARLKLFCGIKLLNLFCFFLFSVVRITNLWHYYKNALRLLCHVSASATQRFALPHG